MLRAMTSESRPTLTPGSWFLFWGMVLLAIWMSPVPQDTAAKVTFTRAALALLAVGTAVFGGLQLNRDRARATALFVRAGGMLLLAGGMWSATGPLVIQTVPGRMAVLIPAAICLVTAFVLDLAREQPAQA